MIKLIASDLDGTLLRPDKTLPQETFALIEQLHQKGILFCPASGRQLASISQLFAPVLDKIAIIAENGGLVWYQGNVLFQDPTSPDHLREALTVIRQEQQLYPLFSTTNCAYYESDYAPFIQMVKKSYPCSQRVDDLAIIADTATTLKISVWDPLVSAQHGGIVLPQKLPSLRVIVSGFDWLDVCTPQAHKGRALQALLDSLHLTADECMAFGDHMNDKELLEVAGHPFVTANAFPKMKELFPHQVPSCADEGVITKCKELL